MASQVHPPRGMRDFLPADKARREHALGVIRGVYRANGFDEIETPVVEDHARLHSGLGGDNEKLSFSILKRAITAETLTAAADTGHAEQLADLGLRFDLTVPLARFYATNRSHLPPVFRSLQIAPVWRAERPQKGRYRQFIQADIDIIGEPGMLAEVELITATSGALVALGLAGCVIRVNDRRILLGLLEHCGFGSNVHERALIIIDKLDKIGVDGVVAELADVDSDAAAQFSEVFAGIAPRLAGDGIALSEAAIREVLPLGAAEDGVASLAALGKVLQGALPEGVSVRFDPSLVRGMGYYTGTIFEIMHPESGSSVGGGGRYDGMIGRFLGENVPAVGFSIGFERVVDLVHLPESDGPESIALIYDFEQIGDGSASSNQSAQATADLTAIKRELVKSGHRVRLEKRQKNMQALFTRLRDAGFTRFALVRPGDRDANALEMREI
jgi:histidyl-tRNA synthetase